MSDFQNVNGNGNNGSGGVAPEPVRSEAPPSSSFQPSSQPSQSMPSSPAPQQSSAPSGGQGSFMQAATQAAAPQQVSPNVRQMLSERGLDTSAFPDDQAAVNYLTSALAQMQGMQQWANYGQQYAAHATQLQQYMNSQQQAPAQPQSQEPAWKKMWNPPEWRDEWERHVAVDPRTGRYIAAGPDTPWHYIQAKNEHVDWQRQHLQKLLNNPFDTVWEGNQDRLEAMLAERDQKIMEQVQQQFQNQQISNFVVSTVNQNSPWMYQHGQDGNTLYDINPQDGRARPRLSQAGLAYAQTVHDLESGGMTDQARIHDIAMRFVGGLVQQQPRNPAQPQQAPTDQRRETFMNRAVGTNRLPASYRSNTTGTGPDTLTGTPGLRFDHLANQEAANRGLLSQTG